MALPPPGSDPSPKGAPPAGPPPAKADASPKGAPIGFAAKGGPHTQTKSADTARETVRESKPKPLPAKAPRDAAACPPEMGAREVGAMPADWNIPRPPHAPPPEEFRRLGGVARPNPAILKAVALWGAYGPFNRCMPEDWHGIFQGDRRVEGMKYPDGRKMNGHAYNLFRPQTCVMDRTGPKSFSAPSPSPRSPVGSGHRGARGQL